MSSPLPSYRKPFCEMCQEEVNWDHMQSFGQTVESPGCIHEFCRNCSRLYCEYKINQGEVESHEFRCPGLLNGLPCSYVSTSQWIKYQVKTITYQKYLHFLKIKQVPSCRICPNVVCLALYEPPEHIAPHNPNITCHQCLTVYCYHHDQAHINSDCQSYQKQHLKGTEQNLAFISDLNF